MEPAAIAVGIRESLKNLRRISADSKSLSNTVIEVNSIKKNSQRLFKIPISFTLFTGGSLLTDINHSHHYLVVCLTNGKLCLLTIFYKLMPILLTMRF